MWLDIELEQSSRRQRYLRADPLIKAWDFPKGKLGDYSHPTSPTLRIIQQETGLIISREKNDDRLAFVHEIQIILAFDDFVMNGLVQQ